MNTRRSMAMTVVTAVVCGGVGLYSVTRVWQVAHEERFAPLPPVTTESTGSQLFGWAVPAAVVAIAAALSLLATRGVARRFVSGCLGLAGASVLSAGVAGFLSTLGIWPAVACVAGAGVAATAVMAYRWSPQWPTMSARYERPVQPAKLDTRDPQAMWDALDRGEDPTSNTAERTIRKS